MDLSRTHLARWLLPRALALALPTTAHALPGAATVDLAIFGLAGRRVRVLARGPLAAGAHRLRWDGLDASGRGVPPGVYLGRLRALGSTGTVRLLRVP